MPPERRVPCRPATRAYALGQMRNSLARRLAPVLVVLGTAATALAHGGTFRGGTSGGPGGPPPGPSDDPSPITQWETWWANNKYLHLEIADGMREATGAVTPGAGDAAGGASGDPPKDAAEVRTERDSLIREALVPLFVESLTDDSYEVRSAAAIALGKTGDPAGVAPLQTAARKDGRQDIRDAAVIGLGLLGQAGSIPFLEEELGDEKGTTRHRSFAAFALGSIGGKAAAKLLVDAVRLPGGELRHRGDPPFFAACFIAMGFTGDDGVLPTLRAAGADRAYDEQVRAFAWLAIGRLGDRTSLPLFVRALDDPGEKMELKRAAAVALGRVARATDAEAVAVLFKTLHTEREPLVRHFAAVTLGTLADAAVCAELRKLLPASDDADRAFLALALGIAKDEAAAPLLRKALAAERDVSRRGAYAVALGLLRDAGARAVLEAQVADHGAIWPQGYAALAIGMARITASAPVLRKELEATNDPRLRSNLAVGLGLLHDPAARTWFFDTLRSDGTLYERGGAAMALGLLRINEAVPVLVSILHDTKEKELMRAYALVALGILVDPADPPKLARYAIDNDYSLANDPLNEVLTIY